VVAISYLVGNDLVGGVKFVVYLTILLIRKSLITPLKRALYALFPNLAPTTKREFELTAVPIDAGVPTEVPLTYKFIVPLSSVPAICVHVLATVVPPLTLPPPAEAFIQ
jgi:hypothetical protein